MSAQPMLKVEHLTYEAADGSLTVSSAVSFMLQSGLATAIVGPSGSGKTALLGFCAGLSALHK